MLVVFDYINKKLSETNLKAFVEPEGFFACAAGKHARSREKFEPSFKHGIR